MALPIGQDPDLSFGATRAAARRHAHADRPLAALSAPARGVLAIGELAAFFELSPDAVVAVRSAGQLAFANEAARTMLALPDDLAAVMVDDLLPEALRERHAAARAGYERHPWRREMGALQNLVAQRPDGSRLAVEVSLAPISTSEGTLTIAAIRDVSERRSEEIEARRTARVHAVVATASEAMLEATAPAELYRRVCESAACNGDLLLAWVGLVDGRRIVPVAAAGPASDQLFRDLDLEDDGPLPSAIRQQQPIASEIPRQGPVPAWAEPFRRARARSACAVPVSCGTATVGALGMWSPEGGFFEDERLALCEQLALLVSHSLERLKGIERHAELVRLGRLALAGSDHRDLLGEVARTVVRIFEATSCTIDERLPDGSTYQRAEAAGKGSDIGGGHRVRLPITGNGTSYGEIEVVFPRSDRVGPEKQSALDAVVNILAASLERCRVETRLSHLALHDPLTGMANRLLFLDHLSEALAHAEGSGPLVGVLIVDLDRFKLVNDALGHSCGDRLLLDVATRLARTVGTRPTVARIGGDEFAVVCEAPLAAGLAKRIARCLEAPFAIASGSTFVTASIGIALSRPGVRAEELLREADTAMYAAKQRGRDRFAFFDDELRVKALRSLEVEAELRGALHHRELRVHYQPIYALTGTVCGLEALVRWHHPARGLVTPSDFIPIAEDTGMIWDLGSQVLELVCAQLETWRAVPLLRDLPVAVNVSGVQLANAGLPALVQAALSHYTLPASCLQVEITETALMRNTDGATRALRAMREIGVRTAIDDFGTGYSSLHYLRHLPVDAVKIDRGFVAEIDSSGVDLSIIRSVVELAKVLGLRTIAEGVERPSQLEALRQAGCDAGQGFLWSPPLPAEDLAPVIVHRPTSPGSKAPEPE